MSDSLWPHGLLPARLLRLWDAPGKNTGVGSHSLLQAIFLTQGIQLRSLVSPASLDGSFLHFLGSHSCNL